jgi:hypothetical protein
MKILTLKFDARAGRKEKGGVGKMNSRPALAFRFQFFSATTEFRANEVGAPPNS